eukprot:1156369-Pelagomonas_calceolata.AAC.12
MDDHRQDHPIQNILKKNKLVFCSEACGYCGNFAECMRPALVHTVLCCFLRQKRVYIRVPVGVAGLQNANRGKKEASSPELPE